MTAFLDSAPLFEEEGNLGGTALFLDGDDPCFFQGSCAGSAFASDDDPVDAGEIEGAEVFQQRLDGEELHGGTGATEGFDAWQAVLAVFHSDSPPDVRGGGGFAETTSEELFHPRGTLGENLVGVPIGEAHDGCDMGDVVLRDVFMKHVAHGIDEDPARGFPLEGIGEFFGDEAEIEAELERVALHSAPTLGEGFRVAVFATGADLGASPHGIPSRISPLDF